MSGHVNMMDDVLIAQLSPTLLRSALRALVSQGSRVQRQFVEHIRGRLTECPPPLPPAEHLFPINFGSSPVAAEYLSSTRCLFSSKLVLESLPYLTHFVRSISKAHVRWAPNDSLEVTLEKASGDIIQAVQALKELNPERTEKLQSLLEDLHLALLECEHYSSTFMVPYPFFRALRQVDDAFILLYPQASRPNGAESPPLDVSIDLASSSSLEHFKLGPFNAPRLFNGLWQMSSPAWGSASNKKQDPALRQLVQAGLIATDMADHYGDAELIFGSFRNRLAPEVADNVIAATKWCIFGPLKGSVTVDLVLDAVKERYRRVGGRVELLQFHWYNYDDKDYLDILHQLVLLTKTHADLVSSIGLCNFDSAHVEEACQHLISVVGAPSIVSNQVQFSIIDSRPIHQMSQVCQKYGVKLLTYGSFCGGFLCDKWLDKPSPEIYSEKSALTPSQRKYFDMILTWGNWAELQKLLRVLSAIGKKYNVGLSNVATRWVLDHESVGAVIVGTRLGVSSNVEDNLNVFKFRLSEEDRRRINDIALGVDTERSLALFRGIGDCGHEYRNMQH